MPPLETLDRRTTVVVWEAIELRDNYGEVRVRAPREIMVKWIDTIKEVVDANGNTIRIDATMSPAESLPNGTIVFRGTLAEHSMLGPHILMQMIAPEENEDLKGRHIRREYGMMRYKQSLPTIVAGP